MFYNDDITNLNILNKIFKEENPKIIFHLAANSDIAKSHYNPGIDFKDTLLTTYNILNAMKNNSIYKIVFASTSAVYGELKGKLSEDSGPLLPTSHYGASKLASEGFISSFVENYNIKAWIFRFPNVVGPRATHGVIYDFINKLKYMPENITVLGDGNQYKPYLYVSELIKAILFVLNNTNEKINLYNIGNTTRTYVKDIIKMTINEMNLKHITNIIYTGGSKGWIGDVSEFEYCLDKIHNLGWRASMTSDEAVRKAIIENIGDYLV